MLQNIKKRESGFTIIEVLIVLAIAGLIMLIVFLAVPALQRNSRNTQREADASKIAAAISNCLSARNGQTTSCDALAEIQSNGGLETAKLSQITTTAIVAGAPADVGAGQFGLANAGFGHNCNQAGDDSQPGSPRSAAVIFRQENGTTAGIQRCIDV